jgi:hypothetical protein
MEVRMGWACNTIRFARNGNRIFARNLSECSLFEKIGEGEP